MAAVSKLGTLMSPAVYEAELMGTMAKSTPATASPAHGASPDVAAGPSGMRRAPTQHLAGQRSTPASPAAGTGSSAEHTSMPATGVLPSAPSLKQQHRDSSWEFGYHDREPGVHLEQQVLSETALQEGYDGGGGVRVHVRNLDGAPHDTLRPSKLQAVKRQITRRLSLSAPTVQ